MLRGQEGFFIVVCSCDNTSSNTSNLIKCPLTKFYDNIDLVFSYMMQLISNVTFLHAQLVKFKSIPNFQFTTLSAHLAVHFL